MQTSQNRHCLDASTYFKEQLSVTQQFLQIYANAYHFSFTFATESTHDDPSLLGALDRTLLTFLQRAYNDGVLNRTALVCVLTELTDN